MAMWRLDIGERGVLAPGRWLWLRANGWAVLLFGVAFGGFLASIEFADWLNLPRAFAYLFAGLFPIATTLLYAWLVRMGERRMASEVALRHAPSDLLAGWLLGTVFMTACFGLLWALGLYRVAAGHWRHAFTHLLFDAYISGVLEEVAFRAILLRLFARVVGPVGGLILSAILFGIAYASHATLVQMVQIAINAGGVMGLLYMLSGRLWLSIGMHTAYDFTESSILGVGNQDGLFVITPAPGYSDVLTGGSFGPDGSILAGAVGVVLIAGLLAFAARRAAALTQGSTDHARPDHARLPFR